MTKKELTTEALAKKAYELGWEYEKTYKGCCQCTLGAALDALEIEGDEVFKAATALAGGVGLICDGSCGAYLGGALLIGHLTGREKSDFSDVIGVRFKTYTLTERFHDRFIEEYGSVNCPNIQTKIFGRPYYIKDNDEFQRFEEAGGHVDKCTSVVAKAAGWLVEVLAEDGRV